MSDYVMEERAIKVLSVTDLLQTSRPLTGASSLSISPSKQDNKLQPSDNTHPKSSFPTNPTLLNQNPNSKIIKSLNHPTILTGTLTLPSQNNAASSSNSYTLCSNPICLQFSDDSAAICCDILDLDLVIIGKKIQVLAWNFIPLKSGGGFLEIIRWSLVEIVTNVSDCCSNVNVFPLDLGLGFPAACVESSSKARHFFFGLLESVSPVSIIPCSTNGQNTSDTRKVSGFLTEIRVCECKLCHSKDRVMAIQELAVEKNTHNFTKSMIVYFYGSASCWQPAVSRLIGKIVLLSGLKKKLVFIGKEESQLMYVTTEKTVLHLPKSPRKRPLSGKNNVEGKSECQVYTGSVTGIYMQGMVIELDRTVFLLLTDHQLSLQHSLRVSAIVTVRSVHLVNPKYSWTKVLIFGACFKSSIHVNAFSPMETGCYQLLQSHSLLRKFLDCLPFSARLWALLVVSSFRKKFAGKLSEKEILGSKHEVGLAQKYSSSCLPLSVFRFRRGVFTEYCQHELCGCGNEFNYNPLKLVVPISNFISHCEAALMKMIFARETDSGIMATNNQDSLLSCGGRSYYQPIKRILKSEDTNVVLLGSLKISQYSGRLQLIDATDSIDIVIPDLPSVWSINDIYEITDFSVVMEGIPERLYHLESISNESFSCRSIFNSSQLVGERKFDIYVYCQLRNAKSRNHPLCPSMDRNEKFKELESGEFHLLWVTHKFHVLQKFPGDKVVSNRSSIYAEAVILPWNLFLTKKDGVIPSTRSFGDHLSDPVESHASRDYQEHVAFKRCKTEHASTGTLSSGLNHSGSYFFGHLNCCYSAGKRSNDEQKCCDLGCPHEIPCFIASRSISHQCKARARKVLLEFRSDSFCKYELLRIGSYYMIKHHMKDMICTVNDSNNIGDGKVVIDSKSHLWSISFSTDEALPSSKEVRLENSRQVEIPQISSDMYLHLSADALSFFEVDLKALEADFIKPSISLKEVVNSSQSARIMMTAPLQSSGTSNLRLPEGNLLTLHGHVVAVHNSDQNFLAARLGHKRSSDFLLPQFVQGVTSSVCIHVLVDLNTVKILSSLSQHAYPIGFGPGVKATFHRVLITGGEDALMLTPASFIVINTILVVNNQCDESDDTPVTSAVENTASLETGPAALICEIKQFVDCKPMEFNCKVVAVYVLVMEKNNEVLHLDSRVPSVNFPLACFVLDDGSSSCCCWANSDRVETLLRLHEGLTQEASRKGLWKSKNCHIESSCSYTMARMGKILNRHGRIVVKNYGSLSDSSFQDLTFSVDSDNVVSNSDEEFLKFIFLNACFSTIWSVVGTVMDSNAVERLEKRLQEVDMKMLPLQNIWASEVTHLNPLAEGRNILQELLKSG